MKTLHIYLYLIIFISFTSGCLYFPYDTVEITKQTNFVEIDNFIYDKFLNLYKPSRRMPPWEYFESNNISFKLYAPDTGREEGSNGLETIFCICGLPTKHSASNVVDIDICVNNQNKDAVQNIKIYKSNISLGVPILSGAIGAFIDDYRIKKAKFSEQYLNEIYHHMSLKQRRIFYLTDNDFLHHELSKNDKIQILGLIEKERKQELQKNALIIKKQDKRTRTIVISSKNKFQWSKWYRKFFHSQQTHYSTNYLESIQNNYKDMIKKYLNLEDEIFPPKIKPPTIIPSIKIKQGEFESNKEFEERVNNAIQKREREIASLQKKYKERVLNRNNKIKSLKTLRDKRKVNLLKEKVYFLRDAISKTIGVFKLNNPVYIKDNDGLLLFDLCSTNSNFKERISIKGLSSDEVRLLYNNPKEIMTEVTFYINKDNSFKLLSINLISSEKYYVASLAENMTQNIAQGSDPKFVVLKTDKSELDKLKNMDKFQEQNPELKDNYRVSVITFNDGYTIKTAGDPIITHKIEKIEESPLHYNYYLFVLGIEEYDEIQDVPYSDNSAKLIALLFQKKFGIPKQNSTILTDKRTTGTIIQRELDSILHRLMPEDKLYFYYSGHGVPAKDGQSIYLLPRDGSSSSYEYQQFNFNNIIEKITTSKAGRSFIFLDTCFSGKISGNKSLFEGVASIEIVYNKIPIIGNVTVFYAGKGNQFANDYKEKGHRLFSYFLIEGILNEKIQILDLSKFMSKRVRSISLIKGKTYIQEPYIDGVTKGTL